MAAALAIAVLFAGSFIILRIAAVAMRLTGLPENIARFQSVSALTGAGFTTSESEMIVHYPVRRRIVVILMVLGNLGLVSTASTLIVSFAGGEQTAEAILTQVLMFAGAIAVILVVMLNKTLDRAMCAVVGFLLERATSLGARRFHRLLQLHGGNSVAEHEYRGDEATTVGDLLPKLGTLQLLGIRGDGAYRSGPYDAQDMVGSSSLLICYGRDAEHDALETVLD